MIRFILIITVLCVFNLKLLASDVEVDEIRVIDNGIYNGFDYDSMNNFVSYESLDKDILDNFFFNSAPDILDYLPGVIIEKTGIFGRSDIIIRGIGSNGRRLAVMIDGRTTKMGLFNCSITHSLIFDNVKKIEVLKGPNPVLFGNDAMGGVINIVSDYPEKRCEFKVLSGIGSYSTKFSQIKAGGYNDKLSYYFTADYRESDGYWANSGYHGRDYTGKCVFDFFDYLCSFNFKFFDGKKYEPDRAYENISVVSDKWDVYKRNSFDLTFERKTDDVYRNIKFYRNFGDNEFSDGWHSRDYTNGVNVRFITKYNEKNKLNWGIEYKNQGGKRLDSNEHRYSIYQVSLYFLDEVVFNRLWGNWGVRYLYDKYSDSLYSAQGTIGYYVNNNTQVQFSYAYSERPPFLNELFIFPISNEGLNEEKITDCEAGVLYRLNENLSFEANVYKMFGRDFIVVSKESGGFGFKFNNAEDFDYKGFECSIDYKIKSNFWGKLSYSKIDPDYLTRGISKDVVNGIMIAKYGRLKISSSIKYVWNYYSDNNNENEINPYFLCNLMLNYNIKKKVSVFAVVNNLTNRDYIVYTDIPGGNSGLYKMPHRNYYAGLRIEVW